MKTTSRLTDAIFETANDMRRLGVMDAGTREKITLRHVDQDALPMTEPISGDEIRALREKARLSQAVFARRLNVTAGYISQLERGAKQPKGPALALLNIIRRSGVEVIL